jgi:hypothetical protein
MTTTPNIHISAPAGAVSVSEWRTQSDEEYRSFECTYRPVRTPWREVTVNIDGEQWSDGRVDYFMTLRGRSAEVPLHPDDVGPLTEALLAAGDEIQRLSGPRADELDRLAS